MMENSIKFIDATEDHLELLFRWRNQLFIREVMYNSEPLEWETHVAWFNHVINNENKYVKILYYNGIPYGSANFQLLDMHACIGEWGIYIGEKTAPKGLGSVIAYKMLSFLFEELNVKKVCAKVIDYNTNSLRFHKKIGFKSEGILRNHIFKNDKYCDVYLFGILAEEWLISKKDLAASLKSVFEIQ